jgi:hypothetical protein
MRRLALGLLTACLAVVVSACSNGGSAFTGNSAPKLTSLSLTASGSTSVFRLANQPGAYLAISAQGVAGSTFLATDAFDQTFQWTAAYAGPPTQYNGSALGTPSNCPAAPTGPYAGNALFVSPPTTIGSGTNGTPAAAAVPYVPGTNVQSNTIYVSPIVNPQINAAGAAVAAYCLLVTATHTSDGISASVVVYVSN